MSLPLIGFALAAIFPAIIWLMPKCLPEALVPAAIGLEALLHMLWLKAGKHTSDHIVRRNAAV
ncbi:MAG: hypothetical protein WBA43_01135 [Elainellaceae cyanobacterium]